MQIQTPFYENFFNRIEAFSKRDCIFFCPNIKSEKDLESSWDRLHLITYWYSGDGAYKSAINMHFIERQLNMAVKDCVHGLVPNSELQSWLILSNKEYMDIINSAISEQDDLMRLEKVTPREHFPTLTL